MENVKEDFDKYWKGEAIKIAMQEQLNILDELELKALFKRAKVIYVEGYRQNIHLWEDLAKEIVKIDKLLEDKEPEVKETKPDIIEEDRPLEEYEKKCPGCGEIINKSWESHLYKKNGQKCGYTFK